MPRTPKVSHGFRNKGELMASKEVGCFACLEVFPPSHIKEWVDDGQTALCPYCGVDAVVARNPNESPAAFKSKLQSLTSRTRTEKKPK